MKASAIMRIVPPTGVCPREKKTDRVYLAIARPPMKSCSR